MGSVALVPAAQAALGACAAGDLRGGLDPLAPSRAAARRDKLARAKVTVPADLRMGVDPGAAG